MKMLLNTFFFVLLAGSAFSQDRTPVLGDQGSLQEAEPQEMPKPVLTEADSVTPVTNPHKITKSPKKRKKAVLREAELEVDRQELDH